MSLIYEPKGKAREYSPLALNVYTGGCEHACDYCYCAGIGAWGTNPNPRNLKGLERDAEQAEDQVLLSFMADPYGPCERTHRNTRHALGVLRAAGCSVAILTKGGKRCLDDIALFANWPDSRIKVGATLTMANRAKSLKHEPGAALPADRIEALRALHEAGVQTWASIEPVIYPDESLSIIEKSLPYVDAYKVGKLNHRKNNTDWNAFGIAAVNMIRHAGKRLYVKDDLRAEMRGFRFTQEEQTADSLTLPKRPKETLLL